MNQRSLHERTLQCGVQNVGNIKKYVYMVGYHRRGKYLERDFFLMASLNVSAILSLKSQTRKKEFVV